MFWNQPWNTGWLWNRSRNYVCHEDNRHFCAPHPGSSLLSKWVALFYFLIHYSSNVWVLQTSQCTRIGSSGCWAGVAESKWNFMLVHSLVSTISPALQLPTWVDEIYSLMVVWIRAAFCTVTKEWTAKSRLQSSFFTNSFHSLIWVHCSELMRSLSCQTEQAGDSWLCASRKRCCE